MYVSRTNVNLQLMNSSIKEIFASHIKILQGFDFEEFVKDLLLIRYGIDGFIPTRPKKDNGCDGIIVGTKTVIACYGPEKYDDKAYSKKAKEDNAAYKKHWEAKFPNWQFVFNGKLGKNAITLIDNLHKDSIPWGVDQIMSIISNEINSTQRRKVAHLLGISNNLISQDYLGEILENLLSNTSTNPADLHQFKSKNLTYVEDKIKLNYDKSDVDLAIAEFEDMLPNILETGNLFQVFEDEEQDKIKSRVRNDYKNANGSFKERLQVLTDNYLNQYSTISDSDYRHNVLTVLLYLFEQCLIGISEKQK